jgi:hypothetical protein
MLFSNLNHSPLLALTKNQNAEDVDILLKTYADENKIPYISIHAPHEFKSFLTPYQADEKGTIKTLPKGPLTPFLLDEEKGRSRVRIVVINATTRFSVDDLATFKSLLDTPPTLPFLAGKIISPDLRIIWIANPDTVMCSAFSSRCKTWSVAPEFFNVTPTLSLEVKKENKQIEKDLGMVEHWQAALFGNPALKDGAVFAAIKQGCNLTFYNSPLYDSNFRLFLHRFKCGAFLFNGEMHPVPSGLNISLEKKSYESKASNIRFLKEDTHAELKKIYIYAGNLNELKEQVQSSERGMIKVPGFLERYNESRDIFYVTDSISNRQWSGMAEYIRIHYPSKSFNFLIAPGVKIEDYFHNDNQPSINKCIVFSPDPELAASVVTISGERKENLSSKIVIPVSTETRYDDLIAEIKLNHFKEKILLKELMNGSLVVLVGQISPLLYQQLLPLLDKRVHIHCNGSTLEFPGTLFAILPTAYKKALPLIAAGLELPTMDYASLFSKDLTTENLYQKIQLFLFLSQKLPHLNLSCSYLLLNKFMTTLSHPSLRLHKHNPIKEIFNDWYSFSKEDTAYLSVLAKWFFASEDGASPRFEKLPMIDPRDIWQRLDCFNGRDLQTILGCLPDRASLNIDSLGHLILPPKAAEKMQSMLDLRETKAESKVGRILTSSKSMVIEKQISNAKELIRMDRAKMVILKGSFQSLKEKWITDLAKNAIVFSGNEKISSWIKATSETNLPIILLLKASELGKEGQWNCLNDLFLPLPKIFYQGDFYPLSSQHKVIVDWNVKNTQIFEHTVFLNHGKVVCFSKLDQTYIEKMLNVEAIQPSWHKLYQAYETIQKFSPSSSFSYLDLQSLVQRFLSITKLRPGNLNKAIIDACMGEFAGIIDNPNDRKRFIDQIIKENMSDNEFFDSLPPLIDFSFDLDRASLSECFFSEEKAVGKISNKSSLISLGNPAKFFPFASSWQYAIDSIMQTITLAESLSVESDVNFKRMVILEGESGLGKSTLYQALASEKSANAIQVTAKSNSTEVREAMMSAYAQGRWLILDELNTLDDKSQVLLTELLAGKYPSAFCKPGFVVLASSNPSGSYKGRKKILPELLAQGVRLFIESPLAEELADIAHHAQVAFPKLLVETFLSSAKMYPLNLRSFQKALNKFSSLSLAQGSSMSSACSFICDNSLSEAGLFAESLKKRKEDAIVFKSPEKRNKTSLS